MSGVQVDTVVQRIIIQEEPNTTVEIVENTTSIAPAISDVQHIDLVNNITKVVVDIDNSTTDLVITEDLVSVIEIGIQGPTGPIGPSGGEDEIPYSQQVDFVGDDVIYKAWADPGTATSSPLWRIQKIIFVGTDEDVEITWADGDALFSNIWDDRLGLTYT